jgi:RNA methyltransferase, TrmH family
MTTHNTHRRQLVKQAPLLIASRNNPKVKAIRDLRHRKERERSGHFFVDGIHLVAAAIDLNATIEQLVVAPDLLSSRFARDLLYQQRQRGIDCLEVTAEVFESLASKEAAQGIGAVVRQSWEKLERAPPGCNCWVALEAIQYPGNLGTILRTSDAVGAAGAILLGPATDPYDPATVRASMGAIFSQRLIRAGLDEFVAWTRRHGCDVVGTSPAAALDYQSVAYSSPLVLLMGSEPRGLSAEGLGVCDTVVSIPMVGHNDSLNLAVAASVMLYEIFNQRRTAGEKKSRQL